MIICVKKDFSNFFFLIINIKFVMKNKILNRKNVISKMKTHQTMYWHVFAIVWHDFYKFHKKIYS